MNPKKNLDSSKLVMKDSSSTYSAVSSADALLSGGFSYHSIQLTCPECGEGMWRLVGPNMAVCLNCLHRWELLKEEER